MKLIKQLPLALAVSSLAVSPVLATSTNFSHTSFDLTFGLISFDEEIDLLAEEDTFSETYDLYSGAIGYGLGLSYQFDNNTILGFNFTGLYNGTADTSITGSTNSFYVGYAIPLGEHIDIVPTVGTISTKTEVCSYYECNESSDSGIQYGVTAQAWLMKDVLEVNVAYSDGTLDDVDATTGFGIAYWGTENRRLGLNVVPASDSTATTITWSYLW